MDQEHRKPAIKPFRRPRAMLTKEDVAQIKAQLNEGKRPAILATYFGVSGSTIRSIRRYGKVATCRARYEGNALIGIS
jgi:hypothetical protein